MRRTDSDIAEGAKSRMDNVRPASGRTTQLRCNMCGCTNTKAIFEEDGIDIVRCLNCDHVYSSFLADSHYDKFWGDEIGVGDHSYWSQARTRMHQDFITTCLTEKAGRLLDMGCGLGFFLKAIQPYSNWETYGREISPAAVRYARDTLGLTNVMCSRLEDTDLPQDSFNLITMWDVIEHIPTPDPVLRHCQLLLKRNGICFIRTPNVHLQLLRARVGRWLWRRDHGHTYLQPRDHAHHYSMRSIRELLERNGFTRIEFLHLHPIHSGFGNWSGVTRVVKNTWFQLVRGLAIATAGRMNLDNLFVIARKDH